MFATVSFSAVSGRMSNIAVVGLSVSGSGMPLLVGAMAVGGLFLLLAYARLLYLRRPHTAAGAEAEADLCRVSRLLEEYARRHEGALPADLASLDASLAERVVYRPVGTASVDPKTLVAFGRTATHRVIEFPFLRKGRAVLFAGGKLRVVTDEVWAKLVEADDRFRERAPTHAAPADRG